MHLLSIISVIFVTVIMCVTGFGVNGSYWSRFFDFYTLLFLVLFIVPLLISGGLLKDFNNAFRLGNGKREAANLMELKRARESVGLVIKILLVLSIFISAVQGIFILYNMDDPSMLGPYFAVALLAVVYSMGIALMLLPLQARLDIKIQEFISEKE